MLRYTSAKDMKHVENAPFRALTFAGYDANLHIISTGYGRSEVHVAMLLHQCKLSPAALLEKFNVIARKSDEAYTKFANRLKSLLTYYIDAREDNSQDLLIVSLV